MDSCAQHFVMLVFNHFFIKFYFLQFDEFIFSFHDIYNNYLKERYEHDLSTHLDLNLDLWLEAGSSSEPDRNRVYGLSNTTAKSL
jgi:hypothetical protein